MVEDRKAASSVDQHLPLSCNSPTAVALRPRGRLAAMASMLALRFSLPQGTSQSGCRTYYILELWTSEKVLRQVLPGRHLQSSAAAADLGL